MKKREKYLSKKVKVILAVLVFAVLGVGAGIYRLNDKAVGTDELTDDQKNTKKQIQKIYEPAAQQEIENELEALKSSGSYTEDHMLIRSNPFGTNTLSLYTYFQTEEPVSVSYRIHVDDKDIADFESSLYSDTEYSTEHEYELIGLIPNMENEVIFTMTGEDGTTYTKTIKYDMGDILGAEELKLEKTAGKSSEELANGLYVILGNDSEALDFMYYYDNNGILRGEIPLLGYRSHRLIFSEDKVYYSISETKIAEVNRLGQVTNVFDTGKYELHHDYVFDDNGDILILASDTEQDSVEDIILKLNRADGSVEEVLDLGSLFSDYKASCVKNSDGELDWMHINTIQWTKDGSVLLSSRETSSIISIGNLYTKPEINYIIGESQVWEGTGYEDLVLEKKGDFSSQAGQHSVTYVEDASLPEGQYYLYMYNNNCGVSESRPDFDWSVIDGVQSEAVKGDHSSFYKYLVDEKNQTYKLTENFDVTYSGYVSSAQEIGENVVVDAGFQGQFVEYDSNDKVIAAFKMNTEKFIYRVYKYSFDGFYFK